MVEHMWPIYKRKSLPCAQLEPSAFIMYLRVGSFELSDTTQQEDLFQAFVYTRGGPSWQTVQIPFSDFLLTSLGYVQNEQV